MSFPIPAFECYSLPHDKLIMDRSKASDSTRKYICVHGLTSWLSTSFEYLKWNCDIISGQLTLTYFTQKFPLKVIISFFFKYIISKSLKLNVLNFNRHHVTIPSLTSVNQKYGSPHYPCV